MDYTSRLALRKPTDGESQDVADVNFNSDRLDLFVGAKICTSTTRPTGSDRWDGVTIKETDTKAFGIWDAGSATWLMFDTTAQTFVPVVKGGGVAVTMGNGAAAGRYFRRGKLCKVTGSFAPGTTTAYPGAGAMTFGHPLPSATHAQNGWSGTVDGPIGHFNCVVSAQHVDGYIRNQPVTSEFICLVQVVGPAGGGAGLGSLANYDNVLSTTFGLNALGASWVNYYYEYQTT